MCKGNFVVHPSVSTFEVKTKMNISLKIAEGSGQVVLLVCRLAKSVTKNLTVGGRESGELLSPSLVFRI
jgi:hypothetical protein